MQLCKFFLQQLLKFHKTCFSLIKFQQYNLTLHKSLFQVTINKNVFKIEYFSQVKFRSKFFYLFFFIFFFFLCYTKNVSPFQLKKSMIIHNNKSKKPQMVIKIKNLYFYMGNSKIPPRKYSTTARRIDKTAKLASRALKVIHPASMLFHSVMGKNLRYST